MTCGSKTKYGQIRTSSGYTQGGYSRKMTVNQRFVISIPAEYPMTAAGPMMCVGVAAYTALKVNAQRTSIAPGFIAFTIHIMPICYHEATENQVNSEDLYESNTWWTTRSILHSVYLRPI